MARQQAKRRFQVLVVGNWGGKVVSANTNYATGGPVHYEEGDPVPAQAQERDSDEESGMRYIGDVIELPRRRGLDLVRSRNLGLPDAEALRDPEAAADWIAKVRAGVDPDAADPLSPAGGNGDDGKADDPAK